MIDCEYVVGRNVGSLKFPFDTNKYFNTDQYQQKDCQEDLEYLGAAFKPLNHHRPLLHIMYYSLCKNWRCDEAQPG